MQLHIYNTPDELSRALAAWITKDIEAVLQKKENYTWVLTGGNSPKQLYDLLASETYAHRIDWSRMHIFWGDERAVPFEDDRNNAKMTFEHLLNHVPIVKEQVHIMRTDLDPHASAVEYETLLKKYFSAGSETFDLVLNGMGDDGHTLSLFPGTPVIHEKKDWVKAYYLEQQSMYRITLTPVVVNRAKKITFLAFGKNKAHALSAVIEGKSNPDLYPAQIIQPVSGELHWFTDEAAAAALKQAH